MGKKEVVEYEERTRCCWTSMEQANACGNFPHSTSQEQKMKARKACVCSKCRQPYLDWGEIVNSGVFA